MALRANGRSASGRGPKARGERQARSSGDVGDEHVTNAFARKDSKPPPNDESPVRGYSHATHATNPMASKAKIFPKKAPLKAGLSSCAGALRPLYHELSYCMHVVVVP